MRLQLLNLIDGPLKGLKLKNKVLEGGCACVRIWLVWNSVWHTSAAPDVSAGI